MKFGALCFLLTVMLSAWPARVFPASQALGDPAEQKGGKDSTQGSAKDAGKNDIPKSNLRMEEVEIHGDVEKPKTMFVIPRASLQFSRKDYDKDFTGEILDPVTKQGIEDSQRWREAVPLP
jgi:hypothetical protein